MSKRFPVAIPEPGETLEGLKTTVRSMKALLELMVGDRDRDSLGVPRIYLQRTPPDNGTQGDIWVNTDTKVLAYYTPLGTWEAIA